MHGIWEKNKSEQFTIWLHSLYFLEPLRRFGGDKS